MHPPERFSFLLEKVNGALDECFPETGHLSGLAKAMRYSLLAGGKRIRPVLLMAFCEMSGGDADSALSAACGIEMLHTYSLIHDDLPCMDDDDLRRGKPTCHRVYGETTAVLAGDALQAAAFASIARSVVPAGRIVSMTQTLADAAGEPGMCMGQYLDMDAAEGSAGETELLRIHSLKTGALLRAACVMGVECAGGSQQQLNAADAYAEHLGLAFQIRDDMLDEISTYEILGKPAGSDSDGGKVTFASLLGIEKCARLVEEHTAAAIASLGDAFPDPSFAVWLAGELAAREK